MKRIMKKGLLTAAVALLGLGFTGCGNNNSTTGDSSSSANEKVKIEYWYGLGSEADKTMKEIISDFNSSQDKYEVTAVPQADYSETYQKLQAAIASSTAPGLVILGNGAVADLGSKKALTSLDSFVKEDKAFDKSNFLDVFMTQASVSDTLYALPAYGTTQVMYYRKDLFEKAGIDPTDAFSSWEKLVAASKKIKEAGIAEFGFSPMWGSSNLVDIALSNGGTILSKDGTKVTIDTDAWIDSWEMIRTNLHDTKTFGLESGGQGWEYWYKTIDDVMVGNSAGYLGSSGDKGNLDFSKIDSAEQPGMGGNEAKPVATALYLAIPDGIKDEEKQAAYVFMTYFTSVDVQVKWSKTIGYIPVIKDAVENQEYANFIKENPYNGIPFQQAQHASVAFIDPTGGKITDALTIAADKVELENKPAAEALAEAQKTAQAALDEYLKK